MLCCNHVQSGLHAVYCRIIGHICTHAKSHAKQKRSHQGNTQISMQFIVRHDRGKQRTLLEQFGLSFKFVTHGEAAHNPSKVSCQLWFPILFIISRQPNAAAVRLHAPWL